MTIVANIKPNFLPLTLIIYDANILPVAVPTIIKAAGRVAKDLFSIIVEPIIPLRKTVIGAAVKENICASKRTVKFLLITIKYYIISFFVDINFFYKKSKERLVLFFISF